jgi:hypothetical protein
MFHRVVDHTGIEIRFMATTGSYQDHISTEELAVRMGIDVSHRARDKNSVRDLTIVGVRARIGDNQPRLAWLGGLPQSGTHAGRSGASPRLRVSPY